MLLKERRLEKRWCQKQLPELIGIYQEFIATKNLIKIV